MSMLGPITLKKKQFQFVFLFGSNYGCYSKINRIIHLKVSIKFQKYRYKLMQKYHVYLIIAVAFESFGMAAMQSSQQFTKFWPTVLTAVGLGIALYMMTLTLKYMPLGIVYALWSGFGIILITAISVFFYKQAIDLWAILGLGLIIVGITIIHLFSKTATL